MAQPTLEEYANQIKAEYQQTAVRYKSLKTHIDSIKNVETGLDATLRDGLGLLEYQLKNMLGYLRALEVRALLMGIELSDLQSDSPTFIKWVNPETTPAGYVQLKLQKIVPIMCSMMMRR